MAGPFFSERNIARTRVASVLHGAIGTVGKCEEIRCFHEQSIATRLRGNPRSVLAATI
jgi:hypothetical protein